MTSRSSRTFARSSRYRLRPTRPTRRRFPRVPRKPLQTCSRDSRDQNKSLRTSSVFSNLFIYKNMKKVQNFVLIQGVAGAGLEVFSGDPRESSSGRSCRSRVASARSARMRATSGKSLFTENLYVAQIIHYVIVYGISLRNLALVRIWGAGPCLL